MNIAVSVKHSQCVPGNRIHMSDTRRYRDVLGHFATGVTVITTLRDAEPVGMAVNSFTSVSLDPPLIAFCAALGSSTWDHIARAGHFCVNVLCREQAELSHRFAARDTDRFAGVAWTPAPSGAPRLTGAAAWFDCQLESRIVAGDHVIALGRVIDLDAEPESVPLVFFRGDYQLPRV